MTPFSMITSKSPYILLGLCFTSCAVGPDFKLPDSVVPATWGFGNSQPVAATPANPADLSQWWHRFNDAKLNSLVEQALDANLDVKIAVARLRQARAQRQGASASFWPWLNSSGGESQSALGGSGPAAGS